MKNWKSTLLILHYFVFRMAGDSQIAIRYITIWLTESYKNFSCLPCSCTLIHYVTFYCVIISESVYQQLQKGTKQSMKNAYAEGTFKNLCTQIKTFLIFCEYFKLSPLPVSVETLCMYAQFLNRSFRSVSSIKNYLSGVKTLHLLLDVEYPQNNMTQ